MATRRDDEKNSYLKNEETCRDRNMNIVNNSGLSKYFVFLAVTCAFHVQLVSANEWQDDYISKSGFSGFNQSSASARYKDDIGNRQWASGSSFNEENRVRYRPATSRNPWKPVNHSFNKKTFGAKRPWGNVPDRKPSVSNMKFHDQRFKQWINQKDLSSYDLSAYRTPLLNYEQSPLFFPGDYSGFGSIYNNPLMYPGQRYSYTGLPGRPWNW